MSVGSFVVSGAAWDAVEDADADVSERQPTVRRTG
jgi:hypothetical protein